MNLETVNYYRIARDEDRRSTEYDRVFEAALRWEPDSVDAEMVEHGKRHLGRLRDGDEVSERHLQQGFDYLIMAILHYDLADWEPYPGRNVEAARDLRALATEIMGLDQPHVTPVTDAPVVYPRIPT